MAIRKMTLATVADPEKRHANWGAAYAEGAAEAGEPYACAIVPVKWQSNGELASAWVDGFMEAINQRKVASHG